MGLFDDLLKKPSDTTGSTTPVGGTGGSHPGDDSTNPAVQAARISVGSTPIIKIEKTEEQSISTDSFFSDITTNTSASPTPILTETQNIQTESIVLEKPETSGILSISEETPSATGSMDILMGLDSPTQNTPSANDLMSIVSNQGTVEAPIVNEIPLITENTPALSSSSENFSSFFGENTLISDEINIASNITKAPEVSVAPEISTISEPEIQITHTDDFIRESIAKIDSMIALMDEAHTKKLDEAQGYKTEKEHYAELETRAYVEAEKTIEEKSQAKKMKTYLEKELKHMEGNSEEAQGNSVIGTTLTTIAVQSSVEKTRKLAKKKDEAKTEELLEA